MVRVRQKLARVLLVAAVFALPGQSPALAQAPDVLAVPDPAAVSLDPGSTTFLAIDFLQTTCGSNPLCLATLPAMADALTTARAANAQVIFSVHPAPDNV